MRGPHRRALRLSVGLEEGRHVPRDGRIGLIGQADLAEARRRSPRRPVVHAALGEEPVHQ